MKILENQGFTFDDLLIVPQFSTVESRERVDTSVTIAGMKLAIPIIAANMDTICDWKMAYNMANIGGLGIMHRFAPFNERLEWVKYLVANKMFAVPSVGVDSSAFKEAIAFLNAGANTVCVDVAHGDCQKVASLVSDIGEYSNRPLIVGNFAGVPNERYFNYERFVVKVGVGPGSACETRVVAGVGVPQGSAVMDAATKCSVIADGGIRKPADVAKAIGLGASAVMVGGYFAGTYEVPEKGQKMFRGMASAEAQIEHRGRVSNGVAEGASFEVESRGSVVERVNNLVGGLRSAMAYTGASNISEFQRKVVFQRVTSATLSENIAHFGQ